FVEGEENLEARAAEAGHGAVHRPPIALLQSVEKTRVRRHQHEPVAILIAHSERTKPGREFLGIQMLLQLLLKARPQGLRHERSSHHHTQFPQDFHRMWHSLTWEEYVLSVLVDYDRIIIAQPNGAAPPCL